MSDDKGLLCHKRGGGALCYKRGDGRLVYKGEVPGEVTVRVMWSSNSYTCRMFSVDHQIRFVCTGEFTSGRGRVILHADRATETVFVLRIEHGPATFEVQASCSSPCTDKTEDPGVTCYVVASQRNATPGSKSGMSAPRTETGAAPGLAYVNFGSDGKLTGIS